MALRKSVVTLAVVAALSATSVNQPKAAVVTTPPPPPPGTSMTLAAGGGFAVGIIATAALLCIYDVWLKFNGYKNWDGSPKVQTPPPKHHR